MPRYLLAVVVFVAAWSVAFLAAHDSFSVPLVVVGSLCAGMIARKWRIVLVALVVVPLTAIQPCHPSILVECDGTALGWGVFLPIGAGLLAIGVGVGQLAMRRRGPG